jgi:uncharacterized repeat protein (TIGR03803 family)
MFSQVSRLPESAFPERGVHTRSDNRRGELPWDSSTKADQIGGSAVSEFRSVEVSDDETTKPSSASLPTVRVFGVSSQEDVMTYTDTLFKRSGPGLLPLAITLGLFVAAMQPTQAQTFTTLYSFCAQPNCTDGAVPSGVVQATDGNLYGTTSGGGANGTAGLGTVFRLTVAGALTTLHSFDYYDGFNPQAALIQGTDGNLYGTTAEGGTGSACTLTGAGCGTIFRITPTGTLTSLYSFCNEANCADGRWPYAGLLQATDGNFYGTTYLGGANDAGTVFQITPAGTLTTLYSFCSQTNCADGSGPWAALIQATDGNLYGVTGGGGVTVPVRFSKSRQVGR